MTTFAIRPSPHEQKENVHAGGSVAATPPFCRGGTQTEEHDEEGYLNHCSCMDKL
jgi:hypothetical protein